MTYLGRSPTQGVRNRYYKTASGGETSISGALTGGTLTFTDGNYVDVNLNGLTLVAGTDYNTSTANTIAGLSALTANDVVEIVVYDVFSVFSGNVNSDFSVGGNLTVTGTTAFTGATTITGLTTTGDINFGDNDKAIFGAGSDLQITHTGSHSQIVDSGTGGLFIGGSSQIGLMNAALNEYMVNAVEDGAVTLYHDNAAKLATTSSGVSVTGSAVASLFQVASGQYFDTSGGNVRINNINNADILFRLGASGGEKMRLTSNAELGIGVSDVRHPLHVYYSETGAIPTDHNIGASTDNKNYIGFHNSSNSATYSGIALETRTSGAARWLIANEWQTTYEGDLVFRTRNGGTSGGEIVRLLNGGGITFNGDTAAANALDDYEEGTWLPSLGSNETFTQRYGEYTKVGNVVHAQFRISINQINNGSTHVIYGLPYAAASNSRPQSGYVSYSSTSATNNYWVGLYVISGQSYMYMVGKTALGASVYNGMPFFGNGADLMGGISYVVS